MVCPLRKCQGKRGCLCPSKPPPFIYSKSPDKPPTVQELIPIVKTEFKREPPLYIGENAPARPSKFHPYQKKKSPQKAVAKNDSNVIVNVSSIATLSYSQNSNSQTAEERSGDPGIKAVGIETVEIVKKSDNRAGSIKINCKGCCKELPIVNGSITSKTICEDFFQTACFPDKKIRLSTIDPDDHREGPPLQREHPLGTHIDLVAGETYWIYFEGIAQIDDEN